MFKNTLTWVGMMMVVSLALIAVALLHPIVSIGYGICAIIGLFSFGLIVNKTVTEIIPELV